MFHAEQKGDAGMKLNKAKLELATCQRCLTYPTWWLTKRRSPCHWTSISAWTMSWSDEIPSGPKQHIARVVQKLAQILAPFGIPCCECLHSHYKLYAYPGCAEKFVYELDI